MSTTSTSLPKPALSHQNLIIFLVHSNGFLMMSGEISFSMVSARQGTGIMSKLSVYGREETKT